MEILHSFLPDDLAEPRALPGIQPLLPPEGWLRVDEAYGAQMAYRRRLIAERRAQVCWMDPAARPAAAEVLEEAVALMPAMGFAIDGDSVVAPDGARVDLRDDDPLVVLGQLLQEDICVLEKRGDEHVLTAACLCFPARWTLAEKAGRPLTAIHDPVAEYDADLARRVQRLFDGVRVGQPMWRFNLLSYDNPDLHQPHSAQQRYHSAPRNPASPYRRSERQSILRLPRTQAVVFSIHTYVVANPRA